MIRPSSGLTEGYSFGPGSREHRVAPAVEADAPAAGVRRLRSGGRQRGRGALPGWALPAVGRRAHRGGPQPSGFGYSGDATLAGVGLASPERAKGDKRCDRRGDRVDDPFAAVFSVDPADQVRLTGQWTAAQTELPPAGHMVDASRLFFRPGSRR